MSNLEIWNAVSKTDPKHTKQFSRAGGFKGTAIKPIWIVKRLTEQFGPVGVGWGMDDPQFQVVQGDNREVLVYCTVRCWHTKPDNGFYGVGGDKVVTYIKANEQYKRPERWESDDEAFKKAFTDAVGNAFKFVGLGADVHMGQFEDSKYLREVTQEFSEKPANDEPKKKAEPLAGPYTSKTALWKAVRALVHEMHGCGDSDMLEALLADKDTVALLKQCRRDAPQLLDGGPDMPQDYDPINDLIKRMRSDFAMIENSALRAG